ncbi:hypothetical protein A5844_000730 [Enterococcus sp. 10A9_DIV0425]|uniref:Uncharacterized protein n=1 Tax=Candidatus Enterococcus wittei TaxID=1987383 RepID=A0A2C9XS18_9ENTE|nr:hypothetical protein A5844_000730 [Enterococcus sp. 10A9_DIV0425]
MHLLMIFSLLSMIGFLLFSASCLNESDLQPAKIPKKK